MATRLPPLEGLITGQSLDCVVDCVIITSCLIKLKINIINMLVDEISLCGEDLNIRSRVIICIPQCPLQSL